MNLLGCPVTDALLEHWSRHMVAPWAPFYLTDDERPLLPRGVVALTRAEIAADYSDLPLEARDSYATYAVDHAAPWAALLDDGALLALPPRARRSLLRTQWRLGRGQMYSHTVVREVCGRQAAALDPWIVDTDDGDMVSLQYSAWTALTSEVRHRWLAWFVTSGRPDATPAPDDQVWAALEERDRAVVRHLAGTFLSHSGPNCFSTTLAATMPTIPDADAIARLWLHAAPFARALAVHGYRSAPRESLRDAVAPGTILVWGEDAAVAQHACLVPVAGWALNKDAQGWFAPRQLVPLAHVVDRWRDAGEPLPYQPPATPGG